MRRALSTLAPTLALPTVAVVALVTGALPWADARDVTVRVWPVLVFLAAVTVLAELADDAGLFELAAGVAARLGRGRVSLLWLLVVVLATLTTTLLSLDTTAVLLTPVVLALAAALDLEPLPFAMTTVWLANTASLLLPVANLTNLLAVERLGWTASTWAGRWWLPGLAAIGVTVLVLWLLHGRGLRRRRYRPPPLPQAQDGVLLVVAGVACVGLGAGVAFGVPPWLAASVGVVVLGGCYLVRRPHRVAPGRLPDLLPWRLVLGTVSIFLVVAVAERHGLASLLRTLAGPAPGPADGDWPQALRSAAVGALGSNGVNNLPAYLAVEPAVAPGPLGAAGAQADPLRLLGLVAGTNTGPLITVWASLATLLWRERCAARGVRIGAARFAAEGALLVVPMLVVVTGCLALTR